MTEQISKAFRAWLATLERGQTIDFEQAFAAGYRAGLACMLAKSAQETLRPIIGLTLRKPEEIVSILERRLAKLGDGLAKDPDNAS